MDDEVIRVAVGLRLGLPLCYLCGSCGAEVDELGTHGLSCRFSKGRHSRHVAVNDSIKRSLEAVKVPCHLEPTSLYRNDGKRPDGATVVPWKREKVLIWDATCPDTLAPFHSSLAIRESSAVAADAKYRKRQKYAHLENTHFFVSVAVETLGVFRVEARSLFKDIGRRITTTTQDLRSHEYLVQRIAVAVQRGTRLRFWGLFLVGIIIMNFIYLCILLYLFFNNY